MQGNQPDSYSKVGSCNVVLVCHAMLCCAVQEAAEWTGDERFHASAAVQQTGGLRCGV